MLELTKTKTKHQLGDFFFHFSFTSFTFTLGSLSLFLSLSALHLSLSLGSHVEREKRRKCVQRMCAVHLCRISSRSASSRTDNLPPASSRGNGVTRFKLCAPFGAQVAALSQIMANKLSDEIARLRTTPRCPRRLRSLACARVSRGGIETLVDTALREIPPRCFFTRVSSRVRRRRKTVSISYLRTDDRSDYLKQLGVRVVSRLPTYGF